jgi:hypothetical protein
LSVTTSPLLARARMVSRRFTTTKGRPLKNDQTS